MIPDQILSADILDLIFENRNKNYGAYPMRKQYNYRLVKALGITFLSTSFVLLCALVFKQKKLPVIIIAQPYYIALHAPVHAPKPVAPAQPPKLKSMAKKAAGQQWVSKIVITPKDAESGKIKNLENVVIASTTQTGLASDMPFVKIAELIENGTEKTPGPSESVNTETPQFTAELMPAYPGGFTALEKFLEKNLHNPVEMNEGEMVEVKIRFVVGYDGKLKDFEILEDGGNMFNNEVIRVLKKMPEWLPGKSNGEKVSVYFTIPVKFTAAL